MIAIYLAMSLVREVQEKVGGRRGEALPDFVDGLGMQQGAGDPQVVSVTGVGGTVAFVYCCCIDGFGLPPNPDTNPDTNLLTLEGKLSLGPVIILWGQNPDGGLEAPYAYFSARPNQIFQSHVDHEAKTLMREYRRYATPMLNPCTSPAPLVHPQLTAHSVGCLKYFILIRPRPIMTHTHIYQQALHKRVVRVEVPLLASVGCNRPGGDVHHYHAPFESYAHRRHHRSRNRRPSTGGRRPDCHRW
jgi:hypothetical protein